MCFIITLAHGHPQLDGGKVGARPSPSWEHKITISIWGARFTLFWGPFSPYLGPLLSFWGGIVSPFALFWGLFSPCEGLFFPYVESFSKIAASAHALDARVVASVAPSGNSREIARLNLLIHFKAHFRVMLRNPMK